METILSTSRHCDFRRKCKIQLHITIRFLLYWSPILLLFFISPLVLCTCNIPTQSVPCHIKLFFLQEIDENESLVSLIYMWWIDYRQIKNWINFIHPNSCKLYTFTLTLAACKHRRGEGFFLEDTNQTWSNGTKSLLEIILLKVGESWMRLHLILALWMVRVWRWTTLWFS